MKLGHGGDWAGFAEAYGREALDFSANINPLGLPEGARRAAEEALLRADRYPDPLCRKLRAALAAHHRVPADYIVCGAGAADLIYRLGTALRPKTALLLAPAFSEYERALAPWGCEIRRYMLRKENDFRLDESFLDAISPGLDLLVLCEPNNPTGVTTDPALLRRILRRCRERKVLLAADECFLPFLSKPCSLIGELGEGGLLIFRAFTKFYAMAGLRLGYCLTDEPYLAAKLSRCGQPWAVTEAAAEAGIAALLDRAYAEASRRLIGEQREALAGGLRALGLTVVPGEANFLLFFSKDAELGEKLARDGILIRDCADYEGLSRGCFRIAVRTASENERLLEVLGRYV
ncbi:MAG: threonine-phosphate decarboxylase CobD [Lachnospiraceae bacterium]|nr:threonine-phosphate decarboxylase CobD [Lachnospiraceae bacterium]